MQTELVSTAQIVDRAEKVYEEKYRKTCETCHLGEYVVVDLTDEEIYIGKHAETAMEKANERSPNGIFHLIRIGAPSAFNMGFLGNQQCGAPAR